MELWAGNIDKGWTNLINSILVLLYWKQLINAEVRIHGSVDRR